MISPGLYGGRPEGEAREKGKEGKGRRRKEGQGAPWQLSQVVPKSAGRGSRDSYSKPFPGDLAPKHTPIEVLAALLRLASLVLWFPPADCIEALWEGRPGVRVFRCVGRGSRELLYPRQAACHLCAHLRRALYDAPTTTRPRRRGALYDEYDDDGNTSLQDTC